MLVARREMTMRSLDWSCQSTNMLTTIEISPYVHYFGHMDLQEAIIMFDALSQETRLRTFRLLVQAGPGGLAAGELSEELGTPQHAVFSPSSPVKRRHCLVAQTGQVDYLFGQLRCYARPDRLYGEGLLQR